MDLISNINWVLKLKVWNQLALKATKIKSCQFKDYADSAVQMFLTYFEQLQKPDPEDDDVYKCNAMLYSEFAWCIFQDDSSKCLALYWQKSQIRYISLWWR